MKKFMLNVLKLGLSITMIFCLTSCAKPIPEEIYPYYVTKEARITKEDGWVLRLKMVYERIDVTKEDVKGNYMVYDEPKGRIELNGFNLKQKVVPTFRKKEYDQYGNEEGSKYTTLASLDMNDEINFETINIEIALEKFYNAQKEITVDDLKDVKTSYWKKEDIVKLFNDTVKSEPKNYLKIYTECENAKNYVMDDNRILKIAYMFDYGELVELKIDVLTEGPTVTYLSETAKTPEEILLKEELEAFRKKALETQFISEEKSISNEEVNGQVIAFLSHAMTGKFYNENYK
ncbi:MAG: hypothetical protein RR646_07730 [Erysipelotrichaceae bacterium]